MSSSSSSTQKPPRLHSSLAGWSTFGSRVVEDDVEGRSFLEFEDRCGKLSFDDEATDDDVEEFEPPPNKSTKGAFDDDDDLFVC